MFVPCCALVHALVVLRLLSADVHHQGPRVGPHDHIGVRVNVKVGPVSRPGEAEEAASHNSAANQIVSSLSGDVRCCQCTGTQVGALQREVNSLPGSVRR